MLRIMIRIGMRSSAGLKIGTSNVRNKNMFLEKVAAAPVDPHLRMRMTNKHKTTRLDQSTNPTGTGNSPRKKRKKKT